MRSLKTPPQFATLPDSAGLVRAVFVEVDQDGWLLVQLPDHSQLKCESLPTVALGGALQQGDRVVVLPPDESSAHGVVIGRFGKYTIPASPESVVLNASESLTLSCGKSSIEMRADGKLMIRGEDVLVRAKGTKRIRAGTVSIN